MRTEAPVWSAEKTFSKLNELLEFGLIGLYRSVEITEILGFRNQEIINFLTLAVAESAEFISSGTMDDDPKPTFLNANRAKLSGTDWKIGVAQRRISIQSFLGKIEALGATGKWNPFSVEVITGTLAAVPPQFVPADAMTHHPWNGILKNNFFEGSHVLELFDTTKQHLRFLLDESRKLAALAEIVSQYLP